MELHIQRTLYIKPVEISTVINDNFANQSLITWRDITDSIRTSFMFSCNIALQVIPAYIASLWLVNNTDVFSVLGFGFECLAKILDISDASVIGKCMVLAGIDIGLPMIYIQTLHLGVKTRFSVALISTIQTLFITESVIAINKSEINLKKVDMLILFALRNTISIVIVSAITKMIF